MGNIIRENFDAGKSAAERVKNALSGKKLFAMVETYGCQQNVNDSQKYEGMLLEMGYELTDEREKADFIMFNTCAVRENAENRVFGNLGALKHLKEKKPDMVIAVAGCMPQQKEVAARIRAKYRHVDIIIGTHAMEKFPELLENVLEQRARIVDIEEHDTVCEGIPTNYGGGAKAFVSIMYGCNNFCTYCIVPYVRGRERSRQAEDILCEIKALAHSGVKEITLLGQNVNSYGKDMGQKEGFAELLKKVDEIDGIERIRFMSSHPKDISDEVLKVMAQSRHICRALHLPLQSGSDRVLKEMNRVYDTEKYLSIVERARELMPNLPLTTDIIVGFPTETEDDFEKTLEILKKVRYDSIFSFIYSKRAGTPAAKMTPCATEDEIKARFDKMLEVQNEISAEINASQVGEEQLVLVEGRSKNDPEMLSSRNEANKIVNFAGGDELIGKIVKVKITRAQTWVLFGELAEEDE
ncbi:MAG: tRNA (N6-isopentenyl adenosine(37)-C2)-methylthiotransferase MiaB [Clostridia bacterium]|nr:tRNA (N6-isopentenyl adenosine(37)-C2)-methylthiotransferase MiaB [Clostridia bacterium]